MSENVEVPIVIVLNYFTEIEVEFHCGTDVLNSLMDEKKYVDVTGFIIKCCWSGCEGWRGGGPCCLAKKRRRLVEGAYGGSCFLHGILNSCHKIKIVDIG
jgi:hypothetical protein